MRGIEKERDKEKEKEKEKERPGTRERERERERDYNKLLVVATYYSKLLKHVRFSTFDVEHVLM